jgi:phage gpG-like protein
MIETLEFTKMVDRVSVAVSQIPQRAATVALNFTAERFRAQNWVDTRTEVWKRNGRDKRPGRSILVKTSRLKRSPRKIIVTMDYAIIGTNVPYAKVHNDGFKGIVTIRQYRRHAYRSIRETYKTKSGKIRNRTNKVVSSSIIVRSHRRNINIRKNRFMGVSAVQDAQLQRMMVSELTRAIKGT